MTDAVAARPAGGARAVLAVGEAVVVRLHGGGELYALVVGVSRRRVGMVYRVQVGAVMMGVSPDRVARVIDTTALHRGWA